MGHSPPVRHAVRSEAHGRPFPAQCQYIASLYHYVSITGDLAFAKEVLPTCKFLLDGCRRNLVKDTGLVSGVALWPDYPEAMDEDGHDISSLNNSLLYQGLRAMEYLAQALGDREAGDGMPRVGSRSPHELRQISL